MVRASGLALAVAFSIALPVFAEDATTDPVAAFMAKHKDSLIASTELMYWIGACEPYLAPETVTFYLDEYGAPGDGAADDFLNAKLGRIHIESYIRGRKDRAAKPLDGPTCNRTVKGAAADLATAQERAE